MRPSQRRGLGAEAARHEHVRVLPDGAVELVARGSSRRLDSAEVRRAVLLDPQGSRRLLGGDAHHAGALLLLGPNDVPRLALQLLEWAPPAPVDVVTLRETSGVEAVCRGLGVPLEPADAGQWDAATLRGVLHSPGPAPRWPGRPGWWLSWAAVLLAIVVLLGASASPGGRVDQAVGDASGGVLALLAALLAIAVGVPTVLGLVAAARARRSPPEAAAGPELVVVPSPAGPVPRQVLEHELRLGPDALQLRRFEAVVVLPGPLAGGVAVAVLEPGAVRLRDTHGLLYSSLRTDVWCGDQASRVVLRDKLAAAGLEVLESPVDALDSVDHDELTLDGSNTRLIARPADSGRPFDGPVQVVAVATGAAAMACYAPVDSGADWQLVPAVALGGLCLGLTAVLAVLGLLERRRSRQQQTVVDPYRGRTTIR